VIAGEEKSDKAVPPVSSEEKKKKEGGRVAGLVLTGSAQWLPFSYFFCSVLFLIFLFYDLFHNSIV
jgi:hypothetical protein